MSCFTFPSSFLAVPRQCSSVATFLGPKNLTVQLEISPKKFKKTWSLLKNTQAKYRVKHCCSAQIVVSLHLWPGQEVAFQNLLRLIYFSPATFPASYCTEKGCERRTHKIDRLFAENGVLRRKILISLQLQVDQMKPNYFSKWAKQRQINKRWEIELYSIFLKKKWYSPLKRKTGGGGKRIRERRRGSGQ